MENGEERKSIAASPYPSPSINSIIYSKTSSIQSISLTFLHSNNFISNQFISSHLLASNQQAPMSLIPSLFNLRTHIFDPFSLKTYNPFLGFPFNGTFLANSDTWALTNARINWKETPKAQVFKANLTSLKK